MSGLIKWRFNFVIFLIAATVVYVLGCYAFQMLKGNSYRAGQSRTSVERGKILDRNGKILASQMNLYNVYISPPKKEDISALAKELAPVIDMGEEEIYNRVYRASGYFLLKRQVPLSVMEQIRNEQKNGRLRAVSTLPVSRRTYPEKNLASQVIGYTGNNNVGLGGVEYAFNKELFEGNDVVLTIDINVQHILEKVAGSTLKETQAESVMFFAMDPRSGEMLGSAVLPGFDPNNYNVNSSENRIYQNPAAISPYEPGSVFKIFSIAALMNSGVISEKSEFICNGVYQKIVAGEKIEIRCADSRPHGRVRPREIVVYSCNVGAALAAERLADRAFHQEILNFGFGSKTGAWISSSSAVPPLQETAGLLRSPENPYWSVRSRQSIAFGQEISVSALQVIQAAGVIANGGVLVPPKLISHISSADGKIIKRWENGVNTSRQVLKPDIAQKMISYMMDTTAEIGTGWRANVADLNMAVKTGTAQQYTPPETRSPADRVQYSAIDFTASCIALLPAESPSLILYVIIFKPRGEILGGRIAAPAIREAAELLIDYLPIPRGKNLIVEHSGSIAFTEKTLPVIGSYVPNFYNLPKKTLLPLLLRDDIHVEIYGEGWVRRQSPPPGTAVVPNMVIELILE